MNIIIEKNEIGIKKVSEETAHPEKMVGLGKGFFRDGSVTFQRKLREEGKL